MPPHDSMPSFMNFRWVLDLLEFKNQASQCFASNQWCPGVWNSFPFLAWDLSMHPRTQIWFSTNLYALEHVHVVQIWNMHINALKTQLMRKKCPNEPRKMTKIHTTLPLFYVDTRNFLKVIRGNGYRFVRKGGTFPTETIRLVVRSSSFWEAYTQTCPKWDNIFTTSCRCLSMISCQVSWILDEFSIY